MAQGTEQQGGGHPPRATRNADAAPSGVPERRRAASNGARRERIRTVRTRSGSASGYVFARSGGGAGRRSRAGRVVDTCTQASQAQTYTHTLSHTTNTHTLTRTLTHPLTHSHTQARTHTHTHTHTHHRAPFMQRNSSLLKSVPMSAARTRSAMVQSEEGNLHNQKHCQTMSLPPRPAGPGLFPQSPGAGPLDQHHV